MKKSQKIIILKAKVIKLKAKLKDARMELADKDEQIDRKNKLLSIARFPAKQPIESTNTLFSSDNTFDAYKHRSVVGVPKEVEEKFKEALNDDTSNTNDDTLTIEQLKDGDVLVYEGSQYKFLTKGKDYEIYNRGEDRLFITSDDNFNYRLISFDLSQFTLKAKPTPEPITSTTLKTPNEWLKLMSEEERKQWEFNRKYSDFMLSVTPEPFKRFIHNSFNITATEQGYEYWNNISNRYNN